MLTLINFLEWCLVPNQSITRDLLLLVSTPYPSTFTKSPRNIFYQSPLSDLVHACVYYYCQHANELCCVLSHTATKRNIWMACDVPMFYFPEFGLKSTIPFQSMYVAKRFLNSIQSWKVQHAFGLPYFTFTSCCHLFTYLFFQILLCICHNRKAIVSYF